jgi:hypothetical protein
MSASDNKYHGDLTDVAHGFPASDEPRDGFPCLHRCDTCGAIYGFLDMQPKGDRCGVIRGVDSHICDGFVVPWLAPHGSAPER